MQVLLTGASGFVGGHVLEALLAHGHRVRALCHEKPVDKPEVECVWGDLARRDDLEAATRGMNAVVHCAALLDPIADEAAAERINHRASVELRAAAASAGARSFVFMSSMAAIGFHPDVGLLTPDARCRPTTLYGKSKLAAERALAAQPDDAVRTLILRPPTVYGPGETRNFLALVRAVDSGFFPVPGSGQNRMSLCWANTLAEAVAYSLEHDAARGVIHLANEPVASFREIAHTIARALDRRLFPLPFPLPVAKLAALACELVFPVLGRKPPLSRARLRTITADAALDTRATSALGFDLDVNLSATVTETIAWYRSEKLLEQHER